MSRCAHPNGSLLFISLLSLAIATSSVATGIGDSLANEDTAAENQARQDLGHSSNAAPSSTLARLLAQESELTASLRASLDNSERPLRDPRQLNVRQTELTGQLENLRCLVLRELIAVATDTTKWNDALRYGEKLLLTYPDSLAVKTECARLRGAYAAHALLHHFIGRVDDYITVRRQLEWFDELLPESPALGVTVTLGDALLQSNRLIRVPYQPDAEGLRQLLARKAAEVASRAGQTKDNKTAMKLLQTALDIWPYTPGLRDELLKRQGKYAILNVGVRALPRFMSPGHALNDAEKQALDLLFESLVRYQPANDGSLTFLPQLATSLPQMKGSERSFHLRKTARWSTGAPVTNSDVQKSFELLCNNKQPGHSLQLKDQVEAIRVGDNPFQAAFTLLQGLLEPLAPFSFKVLPRTSVNDEAFAKAPIGSGPFVLAGTGIENGRTYVRFVVNPFYTPPVSSPFPSLESSASGSGPKIRELRFFEVHDSAAEFNDKNNQPHLLLDVPTQDLTKLKASGINDVRTLPTRRVYFLAVNNRDSLLSDDALRRAFAHAIHREQVISDCFGGGRPRVRSADNLADGTTIPETTAPLQSTGPSFHHPLNGLYPAGSWAVCSDGRVPKDLFDRARAETFLKKSKAQSFDLELKYPDDDPRIQRACQAIAMQLASLGDRVGRPIKIRLVGLSPRQLERDILARRYQLAYWHHDFPDDMFNLWPLFDPREEALASGSNYLGFNDVTLIELLQQARSFRDFSEVKRLTHDIHAVLVERMPLIPLWQLDYHLAVHPKLRLPVIDPMRVFADIGEWELKD
jgi:peptide/nickel transport system substrate-binding protein